MDSPNLLGDFLRARRDATSPTQVGLLDVGRRRTPGLRREEVAMLADVSTDYYTRLEQGRERHPSYQVLDALARALDLGPDAALHLHEIAYPRTSRCAQAQQDDQVHPNVLRLLHGWERSPALVMNHLLDVLAKNHMATALHEGLQYSDNLLRLALLNPEARAFYLDWEADTRSKVAHLRASAGMNCDDHALIELVEELSRETDEFRSMWESHQVEARTRAPMRLHHREVGDLIIQVEVLGIDSTPNQKLVVLQAEPGSPSEDALIQLSRRVHHQV
jgi:transcriptional regulator with XRE-family HTH domain